MQSSRVYEPSATFRRVHDDDSFLRCIMGPVGSGKTTGCIMEVMLRAQAQRPNSQGVRKSRWAFFRSNYPQLKDTTLRTWQEWMPPQLMHVSQQAPYRGKMRAELPDKTIMELEVIFIAIEKAADVEEKLRSLELTGAFVNEANLITQKLLHRLPGRVGRYPSKADGGPSWRGIIMDMNPPEEGHFLHQLFEVKRPAKAKIFYQPAALLRNPDAPDDLTRGLPNPAAENIAYLPDGYDYYYDQMINMPMDEIKRDIYGEYGEAFSGTAVWRSFRRPVHVAGEIMEVDPNLPVYVGVDWGLYPAAVFTQYAGHARQVRVLDALTSDTEISLQSFVDELIRPLMQAKYQNVSRIEFIGDPSGVARNAIAGMDSFSAMRNNGLRARPARTNDPKTRWDSVTWFLEREEGFRINPHNEFLINAMRGGYRFKTNRYTQSIPVADKNEFSHVADALQYACLEQRTIVSGTDNQLYNRANMRKSAPKRFGV